VSAGQGKVAIGFCYGQGTFTPQFASSYRMVLARDAATRRRLVNEFGHEASGVHVPTARCRIVKSFLESKQRPEWLWMVDTDATFSDGILEQLIKSADPKERPIVGALAFGVRGVKGADGEPLRNEVGASPLELFPTLYVWDDKGTQAIRQYPLNEVIQVNATGAHCLLIHRSVLEDPRWTYDGHPLPWFRTGVRLGQEVSEDQFFCIKAQTFGYPIHVDTAAKTGHVKTFIADEDLYLAQVGR
jgi:hypothetical protein